MSELFDDFLDAKLRIVCKIGGVLHERLAFAYELWNGMQGFRCKCEVFVPWAAAALLNDRQVEVCSFMVFALGQRYPDGRCLASVSVFAC